MRISDWSSDVCSSVLQQAAELLQGFAQRQQRFGQQARRRDEPLDRRVRRSLQAVALLLPAGAGIDLTAGEGEEAFGGAFGTTLLDALAPAFAGQHAGCLQRRVARLAGPAVLAQ